MYHLRRIRILRTFIQEQKNGLQGAIFFYYGGTLPKYLENHGLLLTPFISIFSKIKRVFKLSQFTAYETAFIKSLRRHNIQVILAQYGPTGHRILNVCKFLKLPLVVHFHGYDAHVNGIIEQHNNYRELFDYASKVIAVSKRMEQKLISLGCDSNKIVYNPCVPHQDFISVLPKFIKKQFISVGRFTNKKAPYYAILALKKVIERHPDTQLIMAGDGGLLNTCKNLVRFYNLQDHVKFLGVINRQGYINLLQESLAFVQHSITANNGDMEGTPVAVLEASAAGLPVVSTHHAGIPDIIEHNKTGLLSEEHDVEDMSENMIKLITNVELAKTMGASRKLKIKEHFSLDRHLNILQKAIESA